MQDMPKSTEELAELYVDTCGAIASLYVTRGADEAMEGHDKLKALQVECLNRIQATTDQRARAEALARTFDAWARLDKVLAALGGE